MKDGGSRTRCSIHQNLPERVEEEVKYIHKDISKQALADRIDLLEQQVAALIKTKISSGFKKKCEDCKQFFLATSPAIKKCDECKLKRQNKNK
jgi:hypothetical protein